MMKTILSRNAKLHKLKETRGTKCYISACGYWFLDCLVLETDCVRAPNGFCQHCFTDQEIAARIGRPQYFQPLSHR